MSYKGNTFATRVNTYLQISPTNSGGVIGTENGCLLQYGDNLKMFGNIWDKGEVTIGVGKYFNDMMFFSRGGIV